MTGTMRQIPNGSALNQLALDTARRCGVDVDAAAGDVVTTSPINGEALANVNWVDELVTFLREQPEISSVRIDPSAHTMSIATIGPVDLAQLEAKLAATVGSRWVLKNSHYHR